MEKSQSNALLNFGEPKTDILKKRLLQTTSISAAANLAHSQQNVILNTVRVSLDNQFKHLSGSIILLTVAYDLVCYRLLSRAA